MMRGVFSRNAWEIILNMRHCDAFERMVDEKGQCRESHYRISLLNKITSNLKESPFF